MPTLRAQVALSKAFEQTILDKLIATPEGTVGPEGARDVVAAHALFFSEGTVVPDMVMDQQGGHVLRIPGLTEHGE